MVNLVFDEAIRLKELIPHFNVSLSPLEQHRLREQFKRHDLYTKKEQELSDLQELRTKLKSIVPMQ